ncbi:hypothetical protein DPP37_01265 [Salmonella enterica subsp. enterica serovar Stanley]|nr:hypothetical protein [Salmonella enterica subsp. enterica serovar Stanley]
MGIMIQPTKNRFGVYLVRKAVPKHLQGILNKREIKFTLKTKNVNEAKALAPAKIIQIDLMIRRAEELLKAEQSLTDADIELIAGVWASKIMQQDHLIRERYLVEELFDGKAGLVHSPENAIIHDWLEDRERKPRYKSQTWQEERDVSICKLMSIELDEALEYSPVVLTPAWRNRLAWRLAERRNEITNAFLLNLRPRLYAISKGLDSLPEAKTPKKTFTQLFEAYKEFKCPSDAETIDKKALAHVKDYAAAADRFVEIIGNLAIDDITADHIVKFRDTMAKYPKNLTKKEKALSLAQKLSLQSKDHLTPDRVRNMLNHLSSFFEHAIYVNWLKHNIVRDVRKPSRTARDSSDKPFTQQELARMFSGPVFTGQEEPYEAMDYWIPIILYYTGCRVEEIAQLHKRDIQQRDGVLCMKLQENETQSIKTGKTRYVPVPLHVTELGFTDFVASRSDFLFSDEALAEKKYSTNFRKRFGRYIRNNGIERDEISPTHSFRHTFVTNCRKNGVAMDIRNSITGHIDSNRNESENYGDKPVETKLEAIETIPKLNLRRIKDWSR